MVHISYAICVCDEARELGDLLYFLEGVRDPKDSEIVILVDSTKAGSEVLKVLNRFEVPFHSRNFDGDFAAHKNFLNEKCSGTYIFNIDADEIPQESLVKALGTYKGNHDLLYVPRINICPGYTQEFLSKWKFSANELGHINFPDFQGRFYRRGLKWVGKVHEKIQCDGPIGNLPPNPAFCLWHIKSVQKQNRQNEFYNGIEKSGLTSSLM